MKTIFYVFMISMILLHGCTSVHHVMHNESYYTKINNKIEGKQASMTLTNGQTVIADNIRVMLDSTSWVDAKQNKQVVPTSGIKEITVRSRAKGAGQGCILGGFVGAGVGFLVGLNIGAQIDESGLGMTYGVISGVPTGVLLGLTIGASKGSTDRYVLKGRED